VWGTENEINAKIRDPLEFSHRLGPHSEHHGGRRSASNPAHGTNKRSAAGQIARSVYQTPAQQQSNDEEAEAEWRRGVALKLH
jgi:hypothetical protein